MRKTIKSRKIKKVMFVQPPAFSWRLDRLDINPNPPLGAAYIAAILEREGYEVSILDAFVEGWFRDKVPLDENAPHDAIERVGLSLKEIADRIAAFKPDVVGVTNLFTCQRRNAHDVCRIAKEIDQDIIVIVGGKNPTALTDITLQDPNIDFVIRGEGELSTLQLLRSIEKGEDLSAIDGVAYCEPGGHLQINPKSSFIQDLDSLPFPARHLLPMQMYFDSAVSHGGSLIDRRYVSLITSRGCPAECFFCSAHGSMGYAFRHRSVENVMAEIDHVVKTYQIGEILFEDDNLTMHRTRAKKLCEALIERNYDLRWDTPNGLMAMTLDNELLDKMRASGCYRVNLAIESGNQHVVNNVIRKPLDLKKVAPLVEHARSIGLIPGFFIVIGNPGESLDQMRESFRFARKNKIFPHVSVAMPLPGTELLEIAKKNEYLVEGFSWENLTINEYSLRTPDWSVNDLKGLKAWEGFKLRAVLFPKFVSQFFESKPFEKLKSFFAILLKGMFFKTTGNETTRDINPRTFVTHWVFKGMFYEFRDWIKKLGSLREEIHDEEKYQVLSDSSKIVFPTWDKKEAAPKSPTEDVALPVVFAEEHKWTLRQEKKKRDAFAVNL